MVEHFDDAAELAAAYVEDQARDGGPTPTWWEVKNESTIKSEWDYHWRKDVDSWQLLADFHNRVAVANESFNDYAPIVTKLAESHEDILDDRLRANVCARQRKAIRLSPRNILSECRRNGCNIA